MNLSGGEIYRMDSVMTRHEPRLGAVRSGKYCTANTWINGPPLIDIIFVACLRPSCSNRRAFYSLNKSALSVYVFLSDEQIATFFSL